MILRGPVGGRLKVAGVCLNPTIAANVAGQSDRGPARSSDRLLPAIPTVHSIRASVIIPTRGRPLTIALAIRSLLASGAQAYGVEIVVVDNNSDAAMSAALRSTCELAGKPVRYVVEASPGQTAARHKGAQEARGELLIYVDDDVQVSASWLPALVSAFEDRSVGIAGGPSIPAFSGSVPAWLWDFFKPTPYGGWHCGWLSLLDIGKSVDEIDATWIWGLNFAIRRELVFSLGGFHPDLVPQAMQRWQGDGETGLSYRAKLAGVKATYLQDALLHHLIGADRVTPEAFVKRAYYQGVCDSFTRIRLGEAPSALAQGPQAAPTGAANGWAERVALPMRTATVAAYNEGWEFHQREAWGDPDLLAWIRRDNYWNTDIRAQMQSAARQSA
jgi:glucosyl-dolichyl phosphate glucuronosyltransferase